MSALSTGLSGLVVSQRLLDLIGQNVTNANTPGYHRQVADLASRNYGQEIGLGVKVSALRRLSTNVLEQAVTRNTVEQANVSAQLENMRQAQTYLQPGEGSVHQLLENFFNQLEQLAARPDDLALGRVLLNTANGLAKQFNALDGNLQYLGDELQAQLQQSVGQINRFSAQVAELNESIFHRAVQGLATNDLQDQRDQLVNQMAELVDVQVIPQPFGVVNVLAARAPVVVGTSSANLNFSVDNNNQGQLTLSNATQALPVSGGQVAGLLTILNDAVAEMRQRMDDLAKEVIRQVDSVHATGLGRDGPLSMAAGQRAVNNLLVPLAQAGLDFPPQAGSLFVGVTNLSTGQRTLTEVSIDPDVQNLQDVATALSGVGNMQAVVDPQTNTLRILAQPGFGVDFTKRLPTAPINVAITGTTTAQIGGSYTGTTNDTYTYSVVGSGTVGVTPNLSLEVRNGAGALLDRLDIGQGYEPGTSLAAVNGVTVRLASGTANNGDSFGVPVVAQPDSAGLLPALGLNSFFVGSGARDIGVRPELLAQPSLLQASHSGQSGDGSNLRQMAALRDQLLLAGGTQTFRQHYAALVGDVGSQVQQLDQEQTAKQVLGQQLEAQRQGVSGVDPNEELVHMLQFQRAFQMSARYLTVVNDTLEELADIIR